MKQIWVEAGEVRHLTPEQFRFDVVGPFARSSLPDAQTLAIRLPQPENEHFFDYHGETNPASVQEYRSTEVVPLGRVIILPPGNQTMPTGAAGT